MAIKGVELTASEKVAGGRGSFALFPLAVVGIIAFLTPGCAAPSGNIADIGSEIRSVFRSNNYLNVDVALDEKWDGNAYVFSAGDLALKAIKAIRAGAPDAGGPGLAGVSFTFTLPTRSALGADGRSDLMNIQISGDDLYAAQPDKMTGYDIFEIGKIEIPSRTGNNASEAYCAENEKYSPRFCAKLAAGLL